MISDIRLQHFRSYDDETFEFTPAVNIIVGSNGSGKTNLLEAILVTARGSSYRAKDAELIQYDQPWARIDAHVDGDIRTVKIVQDAAATKTTKTYEIEGRIFRRLMPAKTLPAVIFEPNHLYMLTGSPELRRSYLDDLLEQIDPDYARLRRDYRRVLTQRNTLLKRLGMDASTQIFPWNIRLSELGGNIMQARLQLLETLNQAASELYSSLAQHDTTVELRYETKLPSDGYGSALLRSLETNFALDVARGFTGAGPHREDVTVLIRGRTTQTSASRGETRTAVLMLKVMELRLIEQSRAVRPLLLLDDVFSELDGARRQALTNYLQDYQTFITTTDADVVIHHFMDKCTIIPLQPHD
ncbi:MAG TPA: DNA replication and repair protein RecF [Candidatus Saccharimonadales bacterium]|jgi:DNA replication and repair protein RecF